MELEDRLDKVREELSSGNLGLETNVQVKVVRPILRSLGWDDADSSHMRAEFRIDESKRRVDEALLDEFGRPAVFVEAKQQGHLQDIVRHAKAVRQLFRYARYQPVAILLLTDGETWDFYLRRAPGPPIERRFLRLTLTEPVGLDEAAPELRTFLSRVAVLEGHALKAAQARLRQEKARSERRNDMRVAWRQLLESGDRALRTLLSDEIEREVGRRPPSGEVTKFLRAQGEIAWPDGDPVPKSPRPYTYDELFPDDLPRMNYTQDELEHLSPVEMSDVVEWWTDRWELDYHAEPDPESDESSTDIAFVLEAQSTYDGWLTAINEIREAAEEYDDVQAYLEAMRAVELRQFVKRLHLQPGGRRKQDIVEALVDCLDWF